MTEEDAKSHVCCGPVTIAVMLLGVKNAELTKQAIDVDARCVASACMAWRIQKQHGVVKDTSNKHSVAFETRTPEAYEDRANWQVERLPLTGFCGLAGEP